MKEAHLWALVPSLQCLFLEQSAQQVMVLTSASVHNWGGIGRRNTHMHCTSVVAHQEQHRNIVGYVRDEHLQQLSASRDTAIPREYMNALSD